jgi:hypothetical protein
MIIHKIRKFLDFMLRFKSLNEWIFKNNYYSKNIF